MLVIFNAVHTNIVKDSMTKSKYPPFQGFPTP